MGRNLMSRSAGMMGIGSRESSPNGGTLQVSEFFEERERESLLRMKREKTVPVFSPRFLFNV